jgi:hypothetical protein
VQMHRSPYTMTQEELILVEQRVPKVEIDTDMTVGEAWVEEACMLHQNIYNSDRQCDLS